MRTAIIRPQVDRDYDVAVQLNVHVCPVEGCGIVYAIPDRLEETARRRNRTEYPHNHASYFCPNGHELSYPGKNEEQQLRDQLAAERRRSGWLAADRDQAEASRKAQKAAATRARNERDRIAKRAKAGVCPCCNRTFKQLARHMKSQHPDFNSED